MAIGIRAYQWGWEYYYPKGLNLTNQLNDTGFLGNSLYTTSALTDDPISTFKAASFDSDYSMSTISAQSAGLLSLTSDYTSITLADYNFGGNKLIARHATNLLDTNSRVDVDQLFTAADAVADLDAFYADFMNYAAVEVFSDKPNYNNHQFTFFSAQSNFLNSLSFLNWHDWCGGLRQCIFTPGMSSILKTSTLAIKEAPSLPVLLNSSITAATAKRSLGLVSSWLLSNSPALNLALIADQDFKR